MKEKNVTDYWIMENNSLSLTEKVKEYMDDGWRPCGFPYIKDMCVIQRMVKYRD